MICKQYRIAFATSYRYPWLYDDLQDHWNKTPEQTMINKPIESDLISLNEY